MKYGTSGNEDSQPSPVYFKDQMWHFAVVFWIPAFAGMTAGTGADVLHSFRNRLISLEPRRTRRKMGKWLQPIVILRVPSCSSWRKNRNCETKRVRNCLEFPTVHPDTKLQSSWCSIGPCARPLRRAHKGLCYACIPTKYPCFINTMTYYLLRNKFLTVIVLLEEGDICREGVLMRLC